ncbi:tectonic-1 isoform X2 [Pelobates cultripes]|uniref:Tectonic-1 isoform X2 n=1 Tax=Pelobates cultripes TaxID=61616 RepID=A0AAD1W6H6_PELCU|nr:tectonic-1 isoform X2 [Pelobates cultripes]
MAALQTWLIVLVIRWAVPCVSEKPGDSTYLDIAEIEEWEDTAISLLMDNETTPLEGTAQPHTPPAPLNTLTEGTLSLISQSHQGPAPLTEGTLSLISQSHQGPAPLNTLTEGTLSLISQSHQGPAEHTDRGHSLPDLPESPGTSTTEHTDRGHSLPDLTESPGTSTTDRGHSLPDLTESPGTSTTEHTDRGHSLPDLPESPGTSTTEHTDRGHSLPDLTESPGTNTTDRGHSLTDLPESPGTSTTEHTDRGHSLPDLTESPGTSTTDRGHSLTDFPEESAVTQPPFIARDTELSVQSRAVTLPSPLTNVSSLCVCDLLVDQCDVNCCCDPVCTASDFSVFSGCSVSVVTTDSRLCVRQTVLYSINSSSATPQRVVQNVDIINPDVFCIQATNYEPGLSFITPDVPSESNFDSLLKEFGGNVFNNEENTANFVGSTQARTATRYEYGSPILTSDSFFKLPTPLGTNACTDNSPIGFLMSQDFKCSRNTTITPCPTVLSLRTYTDVGILTVPNSQIVINVTVTSVTLKSLNGTLTPGSIADLDNTTQNCSWVVLESTDRFGQLTLLKSSKDQSCLAEYGNRATVLFGYNMVSGCILRLSNSETAFCQLAADVVLNVLRDQQFPQYVASFGNSQPQNVLDWVPIVDVTAVTPTEVNTCKMPVSLELEVRWTKYGSLVNPQAQIVNVTQKITYNAIPTAFLGSEKLVQIFCSVTFVDVSASAEPGYKAQPTFDAKLPFDFFYPFV